MSRRVALVVAGCALVVGSGTSTASAGSPTPTPSVTSSPTGSPRARPASATSDRTAAAEAPLRRDDDGPLTPDELRRQVAQAHRLTARLAAADAEVARATERLRQISERLATALQEVAEARQTEAAAVRGQRLHEQQLTHLGRAVTDQREELGRWARETYRQGGPLGTYQTWVTLLAAPGTSDASFDLEIVQQVGERSGRSLTRLQDAASAKADVTRAAALAAARAGAARARAEAAVGRVRSLRRQAGAALTRLREQQARPTGETSPRAPGPAGAGSADCRGASTVGFPNGMIPGSALCALPAAPGHRLRADAAAAFGELSGQFAAEFGRPLCVTDSYRTLAAQVILYARKPALAAKPGTSNHGWGTALDLCGGIQSFGTAEHAWLAAHAPPTGWFHPSWAAAGGSRPEPWHWEFAGR
jgi:hypothetical protein